MCKEDEGKSGEKRCVLCGCGDHRLFGCYRHMIKSCSCYGKP